MSQKRCYQNTCILSHHTLVMLQHYFGKFIFVANPEQNANKKCHFNQLSFHSYRKIKPRVNFEFNSFIVSSINDRRSSS